MKNNRKVIRIFSGIFFVIALIILASEIFYRGFNFGELYFSTFYLNIFLILVSMLIVFVRPDLGKILFFIGIFEATPTIVSTDPSLGVFLYCFALLIGLAFGIFKKNAKRRLCLSLVPIVGALIYLLYSVPFYNFLRTFIIVLFECTMLIFLALLFKKHIESLLPIKIKIKLKDGVVNNDERVINLEELGFTLEECFIIKELLAHQLYKQMAQTFSCSESSVKKKSCIIYQKFNCKNRKEFLDKAVYYDFIFPKEIALFY